MGRRFHRTANNRPTFKIHKWKCARRDKTNQIKALQAKQYIRNLSDYTLNSSEINVLAKGLKFIPAHTIKPSSMICDFTKFERRMRLAYKYADEPANTKHPFKVCNRNSYSPLASMAIENYLYTTKLELSNFIPCRYKHNLTLEERHALHKLSTNNNIIIRKADKNNTTVILNRADYIKEGYRQLHDGIHYTSILDIDEHMNPKLINSIVCKLKIDGFIDDETFSFLHVNSNHIRIPRMYLLPKIHKIANILSNMDPAYKDPSINISVPGRPIISQCGGLFEKAGRYLDYFLLPIVQLQDTYIKDTTDFINTIEGITLPRTVLLITYDITSMYTNLSFNEIIEAVENALNCNSNIEYNIRRPPTKYLIDILCVVLEHNAFEFNNEYFRQIVGVPMGATASPEICDIAIFKHINHLLEQFYHKHKILLHKRFRDDGYILFDGPEKEITELFTLANNSHPLLKFTFEISCDSVSFLDTVTYKGTHFHESRVLDIKTHTKVTETYQYLHRNSAHPLSCFKSFIIGEATRHVRNNNNNKDYISNINTLSRHLNHRGYKDSEIHDNINSVHHANRYHKIKHGNTSNSVVSPPVFVTTYSPDRKNINSIIHKHWNLIEADHEAKAIFPNKPIISFKRGKNIGEILTKSKL